jgi:uncharacterized membrane protein YeaQ/YmgE (transglycosylase-associated protein family)
MGTTIIIGFASGVIVSFVARSGFILSSVLGIAGALGAIFLGQKVGWYQEDPSLIEAAAGATIVPIVRRLLAGVGNLLCLDG